MLKSTFFKKSIFFLTPLYLWAVPNAPTDLILTPSTNTVSLSWKDNANNETGFKIYRDGVKIYTTPKNATSYHDSGLQPHTTYNYEILATDDELWYQPDSNTSWQLQLKGTINPNYDVEVYEVDLFNAPIATIESLHESGKKVICYFSAGSWENWREDKDSFPVASLGNDMNTWDGEKWLDIRVDALRPIMIGRLDLAKQKGCDGVEVDNVNGYDTITGFPLTAENQLSYNRFLAHEAHVRNLSIGLKNDVEQVVSLEPYFDFAVNEQCHAYSDSEYNECAEVLPFIYANKPVFSVEYEQAYKDNNKTLRDRMCQDTQVYGFQTLVLALELDDSYRDSCQKQDSNANLLFSSGFEDGVTLGPVREYQTIDGGSWPIEILGSSGSAFHYIDHDDFTLLHNSIVTVPGHDANHTDTQVLYNEQIDSIGVTQCPYSILNITENKDLYIRYWIKMDSASLTTPDMWRTFFEYKTKDYESGEGFRLIAYIDTDSEGTPYWHWQGDANPRSSVWGISNRLIPVPLDEWFLTEFYWHWSEGDDGRALWKVNGQVVGYHLGPTTRNHKDLDFIMLTQIYGGSDLDNPPPEQKYPKHQWIDDIEIWDSLK